MSLPKAVWQKTKEEAKEVTDDIKDFAENVNSEAEVRADSWLDKLKASKWTALMIVGAIAFTLLVWGISLLIVG